jgi:S-DNA-T family DNA segregation ATPase FtsK/SpoIIIE
MAKKAKGQAKTLKLSLIFRPDVLGAIFVLLSLFTLFSLPPSQKGTLTSQWLRILSLAFGWGVFLSPVIIGATGVLLLLYKAAKVSKKELLRLLAGWAFFFLLLAVIHSLFASPDPKGYAAKGKAGGYVGLLIIEALNIALGPVGAILFILLLLAASFFVALGLPLSKVVESLKAFLAEVRDTIRFWRLRKPAPAVQPQRPEEATYLTPRIIGEKQRWQLPPIHEILEDYTEKEIEEAEIRRKVRIIEETLAGFGIPAKVVEVNRGPTVTQFGVEPGFVEKKGPDGRPIRVKVKVSRIKALANDLALALSAAPIRIEAPVPGRSYVGIEVPNTEFSLVSLKGVMESEEFRHNESRLKIALGRDVSGQPVVADLASMPHLLIAGATGSGKSMCINSMVTCLTCINTPETLRLILVDPKRVELVHFNGLPHLALPVIVDVEKVLEAFRWTLNEMARRYRLFSQEGARNIEEYNQNAASRGQEILPYLVVIVDELADIMLMAQEEVEGMITRLAQLARATGIHLVIATQRPSVDVITGLIKANFPARISFAVTSQVDSRVVLDTAGAEDLLGKGDMLFMPPDSTRLIRIQGCYVSPKEIKRLVEFWKAQGPSEPLFPRILQEPLPITAPTSYRPQAEEDDLLDEAVKLLQEHGKISISFLQRKLRIGYNRAARLMELMEEKGLLSQRKEES